MEGNLVMVDAHGRDDAIPTMSLARLFWLIRRLIQLPQRASTLHLSQRNINAERLLGEALGGLGGGFQHRCRADQC